MDMKPVGGRASVGDAALSPATWWVEAEPGIGVFVVDPEGTVAEVKPCPSNDPETLSRAHLLASAPELRRRVDAAKSVLIDWRAGQLSIDEFEQAMTDAIYAKEGLVLPPCSHGKPLGEKCIDCALDTMRESLQ